MVLVGRYFGLMAFLLLSSLSCAEQQNSTFSIPPQGLHEGSMQLLSADSLNVVDEAGQPVANATILVGFEPGNPFEGNVLTTDSMGAAHLPADWKAALPVTVQAPGFVTSTIPVAVPGELTLELIRQETGTEYEVSGTGTGFGRLVTDGKVDFALMIPALKRETLLAFDLSTVISPKTDSITIIGNEVKLPSNISLPGQTENYIFPIHLEKPDYRVYLREPGQQVVSATHGQFPLQRVVSDIRAGKSMFELINHFTFLEGGQKSVDVQGDVSGQDIAVNETRFDSQVAVRAPAYAAGQQMVSLALMEQNGRLVPTDLKRLKAGETLNMKSFAGNGVPAMFSFLIEAAANITAELNQPFSWFKPMMFPHGSTRPPAVAKQDFTRLSFSFMPATGGVAPEFLPLIGKPALHGDVLTLDVPALTAGLVPVATYLVMSEIETITAGNVVSERRTRLWEVWSNAWLAQVELPKVSFNKRPDRTYRWEVMFMARPANFVDAATPSSRVDLKTITHVTRNALDI